MLIASALFRYAEQWYPLNASLETHLEELAVSLQEHYIAQVP